MLPGSDFGINEKKLITRIAFVDFNGEQALKKAKNMSNLTNKFLEITCPNIVNGIHALKEWVKNNSS